MAAIAHGLDGTQIENAVEGTCFGGKVIDHE
jgi:hypothetical protein